MPVGKEEASINPTGISNNMVKIAAVPQTDTSFLKSIVHYGIMYREENPMISILVGTILGAALLPLNESVLSSLLCEILVNLLANSLTTIPSPYNYLQGDSIIPQFRKKRNGFKQKYPSTYPAIEMYIY